MGGSAPAAIKQPVIPAKLPHGREGAAFAHGLPVFGLGMSARSFAKVRRSSCARSHSGMDGLLSTRQPVPRLRRPSHRVRSAGITRRYGLRLRPMRFVPRRQSPGQNAAFNIFSRNMFPTSRLGGKNGRRLSVPRGEAAAIRLACT